MINNIKFTKSQALGNDFVIINSSPLPTGVIKKLAHRRLGIGCDQVIFYQTVSDDLVTVQFYNADGLGAGACGNGSRALALLLQRDGKITLRTLDRELVCEVHQNKVTINMGRCEIDSSYKYGKLDSVFWILANIGNPHRVVFVDHLTSYDLELVAKPYPDDNVSMAEIFGQKINLKTWERGAGYTGACGSAACAVAAIAMKFGQVGPIVVSQAGGDLTIDQHADDIFMTGTAEIVFSGEFSLKDDTLC